MNRSVHFIRIVLFAALSGQLAITFCSQSADSILAQIENLAALGSKGDHTLSESIAWQIDANPEKVARLLLPKIKDPSASESQLATYAWALGWSKDLGAVDDLISLYQRNQSIWIQGNCLRALAMIGGHASGEFLLSVLDGKTDDDERYSILDLLSEMQYEPALSRTEDILKLDFKGYYWKNIFIFCKMGDKAVPFLLKKLSHEDLNVRANVTSLLGQWLISPEATGALKERFWVEQDPALQIGILSSIESTLSDLEQWKDFFDQVKLKATDSHVINFAGETLASIDQIKAAITEYVGKKKISRADFNREYSKLYKSAGLEGNCDILRVARMVKTMTIGRRGLRFMDSSAAGDNSPENGKSTGRLEESFPLTPPSGPRYDAGLEGKASGDVPVQLDQAAREEL